jgi:hypothetical protein
MYLCLFLKRVWRVHKKMYANPSINFITQNSSSELGRGPEVLGLADGIDHAKVKVCRALCCIISAQIATS